ncbi:aminotransferase DegT [Methanocalculus chunghsingensis]|uniref:Aminotransferase DegT n=1 Tax=Methanocalculus chunghsingensis TaxID=156457 RepID=A0A8J7W8L1_9EURY|nr:DegT/DnrJ/EryC1/StrS family aminotransferase [Methanocalculus chunghsingensis]MBR1368137.1 aminotransferase DegT [Methanocalculus chunghsingensis]
MTWNIPLFKMYYDEDDIESVSAALRSGMNWAVGSEVTSFENELAEYIETSYCLTFNSGTSALHTALLAHGIGEGDEVIVPSFTFIATANAPLFVGARPVFADVEKTTLGLDPDSVLAQITPRTRVIMPVHYGGCPCMIRELREIADDHNLILIEDAAEALGASIEGEMVGSYGDSSMLSFCQNKVITTGEGGALVTDDRDLYERSKLIRSHGRLETADYFSSCVSMDYITLGYNFRLSNIAAALGRAQLRKVEGIIAMRKAIAGLYTTLLQEKVPEISVMSPPGGYMHVNQLFSVRVPQRDVLMKYLAEQGIMSKIYFDPVHLTHLYRSLPGYEVSLPVTEMVAGDILSLPIYPGMPEEEIIRVVDTIAEYYAVE